MRGRDLLATLLHFLFPGPCAHCGRPLDADRRALFCGACWQTLRPLVGPVCPCCGHPFASPVALTWSPTHLCGACRRKRPPFTIARAATLYIEDGVARQALLLFKQGGKISVGRHLGSFMADAASSLLDLPRYDCAIPVPLHRRRERERGFNQALILARALGKRYNVPVLPRVLRRVRATDFQAAMTGRRAREANIRGAFTVVRPQEIREKRVLLVDDILTTGATVRACSRVLRRAGAKEVAVYVCARVP